MSSLLTIPTSPEYAQEARLAVQAVVRASYITHKVQSSIKQQDTETKVDKSPVTGAYSFPRPCSVIQRGRCKGSASGMIAGLMIVCFLRASFTLSPMMRSLYQSPIMLPRLCFPTCSLSSFPRTL